MLGSDISSSIPPPSGSLGRRLGLLLASVLVAVLVPMGLSRAVSEISLRVAWTEQSFIIAVPTASLAKLPLTRNNAGDLSEYSSVSCEKEDADTALSQSETESERPKRVDHIKCSFLYRAGPEVMRSASRDYEVERRFLFKEFRPLQATSPQSVFYSFSTSSLVPFTRWPMLTAASVFQVLSALALWLVWKAAGEETQDRRAESRLGGPRLLLLVCAPALLVIAVGIALGVSPPLPGASSPLPFSRLFESLLFAPLIEELVYRAWMITLLSSIIGARGAILISALLFAIGHGAGFFITTTIFASGILLGLIWVQRRSVLLCVVSHSAANASIQVLRLLTG